MVRRFSRRAPFKVEACPRHGRWSIIRLELPASPRALRHTYPIRLVGSTSHNVQQLRHLLHCICPLHQLSSRTIQHRQSTSSRHLFQLQLQLQSINRPSTSPELAAARCSHHATASPATRPRRACCDHAVAVPRRLRVHHRQDRRGAAPQ